MNIRFLEWIPSADESPAPTMEITTWQASHLLVRKTHQAVELVVPYKRLNSLCGERSPNDHPIFLHGEHSPQRPPRFLAWEAQPQRPPQFSNGNQQKRDRLSHRFTAPSSPASFPRAAKWRPVRQSQEPQTQGSTRCPNRSSRSEPPRDLHNQRFAG